MSLTTGACLPLLRIDRLEDHAAQWPAHHERGGLRTAPQQLVESRQPLLDPGAGRKAYARFGRELQALDLRLERRHRRFVPGEHLGKGLAVLRTAEGHEVDDPRDTTAGLSELRSLSRAADVAGRGSLVLETRFVEGALGLGIGHRDRAPCASRPRPP